MCCIVVYVGYILWGLFGESVRLQTATTHQYKTVLSTIDTALPQEQQQQLTPLPPSNNILIIPNIGTASTVFEGNSVRTMDKGPWRRPNSSTPDQGGNTVIVAHRYTFGSHIDTFYHLDKLQRGDLLEVYWNQKEYIYQVESIEEVAPTATHIENPTSEPTLTLYTCTPLLTAERRLVVTAKQIQP